MPPAAAPRCPPRSTCSHSAAKTCAGSHIGHGVESLTSRGRNPVSKGYAHQAIRLVHRSLPVAVADGGDLEARANLLLGAHLAGRALAVSGLGWADATPTSPARRSSPI